MNKNFLWIVGGIAAAYFLLSRKAPAKPTPASITGSTGTAGSADSGLSGLLSRIPWNGTQPVDNTPAYVTAAGGAFNSVVAGLKNLFSTPSAVRTTDAGGANSKDTFTGQTFSQLGYGTGSGESGVDAPAYDWTSTGTSDSAYNPFVDYSNGGLDYNPSDYYDWSFGG